MRLKHITFTGIDGKTDIDRLCDIHEKYPIAEFGILVSANWHENGNRYFNPSYMAALGNNPCYMADLGKAQPWLSAHLCGSIARAAVLGDFEPFREWARGYHYIFKRCQLNIATAKDNPDKFVMSVGTYKFDEVILQQRSANDCSLWTSSPANDHLTVLLDASGGQGIDTPIEVLPVVHKVGYAGGINPDNVTEKLTYLLNHPDVGDFWIDMESGVRTDDWFDIDKVLKVLEVCEPLMKED